MKIFRKTFAGRINGDDDYQFHQHPDFVNAENGFFISSEGGETGAFEGFVSNKEATVVSSEVLEGKRIRLTTWPLGVNKNIGACGDLDKDRIFFLNWNSNGDHAVYMLDLSTMLVYVVMHDIIFTKDPYNSGLDFQKTKLATGISLIGDELCWTDDHSEPRKVNVERGLAKFYPNDFDHDHPYPDDLVDYDITLIRRPPNYPLIVNEGIDSAYTNNYISGYTFQFSYYYRYYDGEQSTLAIYSKLIDHNNPDTDDTPHNYIRVRIPSEETIDPLVETIHFCFRIGNTGEWIEFKKINRKDNEYELNHPGNVPFTFKFYNDTLDQGMDQSYAYRPFDDVPLLSKALDIAKNRVLLGSNDYGYSPEDLDLDLTYEAVVQEPNASFDASWSTIARLCDGPNGEQCAAIIKIENATIPSLNGYYDFYGSLSCDDLNTGATPTTVNLDPAQKVFGLNPTQGEKSGYMDQIFGVSSGCKGVLLTDTVTPDEPTITGLGTTGVTVQEGTVHFKAAGKYKVGLVFYDYANRNSGVVVDSDPVAFPENEYLLGTFNTGLKWTLGGSNTDIPKWATHYAIVRSKNLNQQFFIQGRSTGLYYITEDANGDNVYTQSVFTEDAIGVAFDIADITKKGMGYNYKEGDILKLVDTSNEIFYLRITEQTAKYIITVPEDIGSLTTVPSFLYEVYAPYRKSFVEPFYEVGEVFEITNPGSAVRDYAKKSGYLNGDTHIKDDGSANWVEAMSPDNDYWSDYITDVGRPNIVLEKGGTRLYGQFAYSLQRVIGTKINGLGSFTALNKETIDEDNGEINALVSTSKTQSEGGVVLCISSNGANSIYIGEAYISDGNGQEILQKTQGFIGDIRPLRGGHGTVHPESIGKYAGKVFWYSLHSGAVIAYDLNGLVEISQSKLRDLFSDISEQIRQIPNHVEVFGGYDEEHDMYHVSFPSLPPEKEEVLEDYYEEIHDFGYVSSEIGAGGTGSVTYTLRWQTDVCMLEPVSFAGTWAGDQVCAIDIVSIALAYSGTWSNELCQLQHTEDIVFTGLWSAAQCMLSRDDMTFIGEWQTSSDLCRVVPDSAIAFSAAWSVEQCMIKDDSLMTFQATWESDECVIDVVEFESTWSVDQCRLLVSQTDIQFIGTWSGHYCIYDRAELTARETWGTS